MMPTRMQRRIELLVTNGVSYFYSKEETERLKVIGERYGLPEPEELLVRLSLSKLEGFQAIQARNNSRYEEIRRNINFIKEQMQDIIKFRQALTGEQHAS